MEPWQVPLVVAAAPVLVVATAPWLGLFGGVGILGFVVLSWVAAGAMLVKHSGRPRIDALLAGVLACLAAAVQLGRLESIHGGGISNNLPLVLIVVMTMAAITGIIAAPLAKSSAPSSS